MKALLLMLDPRLADFAKSFPVDADGQIARTPTAKLTIKVRELSRFYRALLDLASKPYAEHIVQASALNMAAGDDILSRKVTLLTPTLEPFTRALARATVSNRATECLAAVSRWQLGHRGSPRDLKIAIQGSSLKTVPVDPYDGKPMRLTSLDGELVVYSVARDGKDDGGRIDSDRDQRPSGDLIYRCVARPSH